MRESSKGEGKGMEVPREVQATVSPVTGELHRGTEIPEEILSIYNTIAKNTEFLRKYVSQIDKLKENIADTASEIVSEQIAQLGAAYEVIQNDYNMRMNRLLKFFYVSLLSNGVLVAALVIILSLHL